MKAEGGRRKAEGRRQQTREPAGVFILHPSSFILPQPCGSVISRAYTFSVPSATRRTSMI